MHLKRADDNEQRGRQWLPFEAANWIAVLHAFEQTEAELLPFAPPNMRRAEGPDGRTRTKFTLPEFSPRMYAQSNRILVRSPGGPRLAITITSTAGRDINIVTAGPDHPISMITMW